MPTPKKSLTKTPNTCPKCGNEHAVTYLPRAELIAFAEVDPSLLFDEEEERVLIADETFLAYVCDDGERVIVGAESGKGVTRGQ